MVGEAESFVGHVFISYAREDSDHVDQLQRMLEAAGIPVWRDTAKLWPGEDWSAKIRRAITDDALVFIACFSRASLARGKRYQYEELTLAIEQMRLRRPDDPWFIPVRFDECKIPDQAIGGSRTLRSIQRADLFGSRYEQNVARLVTNVLRILRQHAIVPPGPQLGPDQDACSSDTDEATAQEQQAEAEPQAAEPQAAEPPDEQASKPQVKVHRRRLVRHAVVAMALVLAATVGGIALAADGTGWLAAAGLAPSSWPMFQHDPLHTGQVPARGIRSKPVLAWTVHVQGLPGSPVIGQDGTIYVATGMPDADKTGFLYAIAPSGTVRWRLRLPGLPASAAPAVALDGTIYVHAGPEGNTAGIDRLVAVNPDGTRKWIVTLNRGGGTFASSELSSPVIGPYGTIYVGSMDTYLYALRPDGTVKWAVSPSADPIQSSPALDVSRHALYFQGAGFELWAYGTDGKRKWRTPLCNVSGGEPSATVDASTGVIYTAASGCKALYAISPNGTIRWRHKLSDNPVATPAIGPDGMVYIGDNGLYAFTPTGLLKWKRLGYTGYSSASPVVAADGTIYWDAPCASGGAEQGLCVLSSAGTTRWILGLPFPSSAGLDPTPAVGADSSLYISAPDIFNAKDQTVKKYTG